jgi:hypothetical protein
MHILITLLRFPQTPLKILCVSQPQGTFRADIKYFRMCVCKRTERVGTATHPRPYATYNVLVSRDTHQYHTSTTFYYNIMRSSFCGIFHCIAGCVQPLTALQKRHVWNAPRFALKITQSIVAVLLRKCKKSYEFMTRRCTKWL